MDKWQLQGDIIGSQITIQDWTNAMSTGATSNPGTVQIHIDRALAAKAVDKDPVVATYDHPEFEKGVEINRKANCKPCGFIATLTPLYQFTVNGGWSVL